MVADLNGIIFEQIYGDNSGGAEFDSDGDGTTTQEDEFVSFLNTTGATVDLSGWEIWSEAAGAGAPDGPQIGLYHTFPPGTTLDAGKSLHIVNEYTGTPPANIQEASEGGVESGAGGVNTNFISEGDPTATSPESVVLVNPATGDYIVIQLAASASTNIPSQSGFPGTTNIGTTNAAVESGQEDMNAGSSYQYNSATDSYDYDTVFVACFASGTMVSTPDGDRFVDAIASGDLVTTHDHGPQHVRMILRRVLDFSAGADPRQKPIEFKPHSLGKDQPSRCLIVSPQHRMLVRDPERGEALAPAKGLLGRRGVRVMAGCRTVTYIHLVFDRHEIVQSSGCWSESFYPGRLANRGVPALARTKLAEMFPALETSQMVACARPLMRVGEAHRLTG